MNRRAATGPAREGLAEDEMKLGGEEAHRLVEDGIGQGVVAAIEAGDAAYVAFGNVGNGLENLDDDGARQLGQEVAPDAGPARALGAGDDGHVCRRRRRRVDELMQPRDRGASQGGDGS
ncbi:hypothetical protein LMH87_002566 [Akanthomyces muscarius]|uniref:Uncharacterized protein n=1 Tax=Akanthomyces muscarius TaxID=2231603 RepID=A0A9W8Q734_AKAMU|nr:hypothetical protein LMH87_002566 [Akanthomyces muscarius]KAJ4148078.1 hypothetical protein LMH87_002566 [Akanthomyces muscarius]